MLVDPEYWITSGIQLLRSCMVRLHPIGLRLWGIGHRLRLRQSSVTPKSHNGSLTGCNIVLHPFNTNTIVAFCKSNILHSQRVLGYGWIHGTNKTPRAKLGIGSMERTMLFGERRCRTHFELHAGTIDTD